MFVHVTSSMMQQETFHNLTPGRPSSVSFKELKSVENMNDWDDTTVFNLLYFLEILILGIGIHLDLPHHGFLLQKVPGFQCQSQLSPLRQKENAPLLVEKKFYQRAL